MKQQITSSELLPALPVNLASNDPQQIFNKSILEVFGKLFRGIPNDFKYLKLPTAEPANPELGDVYITVGTTPFNVTLHIYNGSNWKTVVLS